MDSSIVTRFARSRRPGVFLDFDGTLSEIVEVPWKARPVAGARELLESLGERFTVAAVVSGRSARQLLEWLGPDIEVWGVHGAERTQGGEVLLSDRAEPYSELMARVRSEARRRLDELAVDGALLEDKGVVLNLHYRTALDRGRAERELLALAEELSDEYGLVLARGRLTIELRPPVEFSKQDVICERATAEDLDAIMFIGDDIVDLPAFDALDDLARDGSFTVRVAVRSDESPPELLERADLVVEGPLGVVELLDHLVSVAE